MAVQMMRMISSHPGDRGGTLPGADDGNFLSGAAHRAVRDLASFLSSPGMGYQPGYPAHRYGRTKGRQSMEKMAAVHFSILSKRNLRQ